MKFRDIYNIIVSSNILIVDGNDTCFVPMFFDKQCSVLKYFNRNIASIQNDIYLTYEGSFIRDHDVIKIILEVN